MNGPEYLADRSHLFLGGVTGSRTDYGGKTAWATWWADTWGRRHFDAVIFYNPKADRNPEQFADVTVTAASHAAAAIAEQGASWVTVTPDTSDWEGDHAVLLDLVRWLPEEWDVAVIHDEAPELDADVLQTFVRVEGNGSRCKSILLSQAPGDVAHSIRRQCILGWIGPMTGENAHVFRANDRGAHIDPIRETHDPYWWSFTTGPDVEDRDTFKPVAETYA
jgi:hypothetical protein